MRVFVWSWVLAVSIAILVLGAQYFTVAAERVGRHYGLSGYVTGVLIVATGTSLPELVSSLLASAKGASEIAVGNVVGSNVTNILLILGGAAVVTRRLKLDHDQGEGSLGLLVGSALLVALTLADRQFRYAEAAICLLGLAAFLAYNLEKPPSGLPAAESTPLARSEEAPPKTRKGHRRPPLAWSTWLFLGGGGLAVYLGAEYVVRAVSAIAVEAGVGMDVIAATAVALGTSLPELAVTLVALRSGRAALSVGNILGSNVFNSFAVLGLAGLVGPLTVTAEIVRIGIPFMLAATALATVALVRGSLERWGGTILLLTYALFVAASYVR